ncbi:hypothetical protein BGW80DRAFT_607075 [Lactifluus volemus]|nr:hypothetical protein BGW80DRAFT_607075 [Lactifluus volemus]
MGNVPSSPRGSTPPSSPYQSPRVPPRVHSPPPRDALALMRGQSLTSMATPVAATTHSSHVQSSSKPQNIEPSTPKQGRPVQRDQPAEQDAGEAMPGELEESPQENTQRTDWSAARVAMERAIGTLRHRAEELARETLERRREQRAIEEEEARVLHERKMTIYEDAEPGPLDELRYPPGLERRASENEASALSPSHSSAPTTETLVEEPEQESEKPEVAKLSDKVTEKQVTDPVQDVADVAVAAPGEPEVVEKSAALPEVHVAGPEHSQVSGEERAEDVSKNDEEAEALPQEAISIVQETFVVTEEQHPLDQVHIVHPHRLSSVPEEASDTQSERLSSSIEFPRPNTPHPTIDDNRVASPVPFPVTGEHEDQGYGTQEDEDRTTKASPRVQGKHVHWGSVEAQPAYASAPDEEDHVEEHSPPFSRLLLPPPPPPPPAVPAPATEPQREARAERATRLPVRRTVRPRLPSRSQRGSLSQAFTLQRTSAGAWHSIYLARTIDR